MKKITVIFLVVAIMSLNLTALAASHKTTYADLKPDYWAYESIMTLSNAGIFNGLPDGTFKPENTLTYGEFIKLLVSSCGYTFPKTTKPNLHWAFDYYNQGIHMNLFSAALISQDILDQEIPRYMMAYLISQALGDIEIKYYDSVKEKIADMDNMQDDILIKNQYIYPIVKVYYTGILNGYTDGTFKPHNKLTRGETAKVLETFRKVMNGEIVKTYNDKNTKELQQIYSSCVENFLQTSYLSEDGTSSNNYLYYGVDSAEELKEKSPIVYYSIIESSKSSKNPLFSSLVTNSEDLKSPFDYSKKTYSYVDMEDIDIINIKKSADKNNCEEIQITTRYPNCDRFEAVLIKGDKIVCTMTGIKGNDGFITYGVPYEYYNGEWKNTKLMDFDYIGFYEFTGAENVFLVEKPF